MNPGKRLPAEEINKRAMDGDQEKVVPHKRPIGHFPAFQADQGKAVVVKNVYHGADQKQHGCAPKESVFKLFKRAQGSKLIDGQRIDIANSAVLV